MCEESQKSTKELNKRDTDATCVRNKASQGSVLEGESHLTCHSTHQNLGHKREQSKEWWRFLPGHALSFPFFLCLLAGVCRERSWITSKKLTSWQCRATPQQEPRPLMSASNVTFHRSAFITVCYLEATEISIFF